MWSDFLFNEFDIIKYLLVEIQWKSEREISIKFWNYKSWTRYSFKLIWKYDLLNRHFLSFRSRKWELEIVYRIQIHLIFLLYRNKDIISLYWYAFDNLSSICEPLFKYPAEVFPKVYFLKFHKKYLIQNIST